MSKVRFQPKAQWEILAESMYPGDRLLIAEAAYILGLDNPRSLYHYIRGRVKLPPQFTIIKIGRTLLLERTNTP